MELITAHIGADFDALASLVAAKKLFPQAKAILPGSPEKAVREFLSLWRDELNLDNENDIDFDKVNKLIIVETRIPSRIGKAQKLLSRKDITIDIYDHHPRTRYDIKGRKDIYKPTGATITMLLEILRKKKIPISPLEATVMALGIYEDTGSLTFQNTTKQDIEAVGYLFSQGASLNVVSSCLRRELTRRQLEVLSELIAKTKDYLVNGVRVGITDVESDEYVEDFALLVHKLIDIENFNVIFAFVRNNSKIRMVARSHIPYVKVDRIAERFGGGGHPYAASAIVEDMDYNQTVKKLLGVLKLKIRPKIFAHDIMPPVTKTIPVTDTVAESKRLMKKLGLEGLAVFSNKRIAGIIRLKDADRAIKKGFGHSKVKGYMKTRITKIGPNTPLYKIEHILSREKIGLLPVFKNRSFVGMVSRSDVLKATHMNLIGKKNTRSKKKRSGQAKANISEAMRNNLPGNILRILKLAGRLADKKGTQAFCVGGFVRDMLLGVENFDVDIVLEKDGLSFAKELAHILKGSLVLHKRFGTATIVTDIEPRLKRGPLSRRDKFKIDIATARTEYYEYPAALPTVSFSSIKHDLYRRDFTINAMAVSLSKKSFGRLIDFFNGQRDLKSKKIRVLHDLSFVEDPTRIFRAVRFEQRYNFAIDPHTQNLIKTAVSLDMFGRTQKQRLRDEVILILSEEKPYKALTRMHQLHELRFIHPKIRYSKRMFSLFKSISGAITWYKRFFAGKTYGANKATKRPLDDWIIYLLAIIDDIGLAEARKLCEKFVFTKGDEKRIISCKRHTAKILKALDAKKSLSPSRIYRYLEPLSYEVIIFIMAKARTMRAKERISHFLEKYNGAKTLIGGKDLRSIGLKPGPEYKRLLNKLLYERLDGKVSNKRQEIELVKRLSKK